MLPATSCAPTSKLATLPDHALFFAQLCLLTDRASPRLLGLDDGMPRQDKAWVTPLLRQQDNSSARGVCSHMLMLLYPFLGRLLFPSLFLRQMRLDATLKLVGKGTSTLRFRNVTTWVACHFGLHVVPTSIFFPFFARLFQRNKTASPLSFPSPLFIF